VVLESPTRFDAPDRTPDGSILILNSGWKLESVQAVDARRPGAPANPDRPGGPG